MQKMSVLMFSALIFLLACTRNTFDDSKPLYAPIMLDIKSKTYSGCVKVFDQEEVKAHIKKSRTDKKVIAETKQFLEIESSPTAREKYFHSMKDCETYLEDLQYQGWKNHSNSY